MIQLKLFNQKFRTEQNLDDVPSTRVMPQNLSTLRKKKLKKTKILLT